MSLFRRTTTREANQESTQNHDSYNDRPGKFPDLAEFMNHESRPRAERGLQAYLDRGDIVYIEDPSGQFTRINARVMLVLYHSPPSSYQCLSFCRHLDFTGETLQSCHAVINMTQRSGRSPVVSQAVPVGTNVPHLAINLQHATSLKPNIYLNLQEHWTIEKEVQFVKLGSADLNSYERLLPVIENQFSRAIRGLENHRPSRPPAQGQEATRREDRHGQRRHTVDQVTESRGRGDDAGYTTTERRGREDGAGYTTTERRGREDGPVYITTERRRHTGSGWPISRAYQRG